MTQRRPPRIAGWLLRHFGCSTNNDSILGDIDEQYAEGKSQAWYWNEVIESIFAGACAHIFRKGGVTMKRVIAWAFILVVVFSLGFWTARRPWIIREELPTAEVITETTRENAGQIRTLDFLKMEVAKAKAEVAREGSAESKQRLRDLADKLEKAQEAATIAR